MKCFGAFAWKGVAQKNVPLGKILNFVYEGDGYKYEVVEPLSDTYVNCDFQLYI